ncbi:MAG TPA: acylphosphatase [Methylotenera sp.]|nr:acylphosphatase [Methylotenera sp.]
MVINQIPLQKKLRLMIHGHVQGVFFRNSMCREAQRLGVSGWVRNRSDGSVEAAVHGDSTAVDALVLWAQSGPELAHVERVEVELDDGDYNGFEVIG